MSRRTGVRRLLGLVAVTGVLGLTACSGGEYAATPLPTPSTSTSAGGTPSPTATAAPVTCDNATQSYDPVASLTSPEADQGTVKKIKDRGYLIAGVSADSKLLGSRNPLTGQLEGFDIDMVHAIAQALFGDPSKVQLVVIQSGDRIPKLANDSLDIVARNMTMTCARWQQIGFSAEYFNAGLKILVPKGSTVTSLEGLAGKKVCAPDNTSTMDAVKAAAGVIPVGASTHTGCLVLFQQGEVDAIAGDDTVLAGLAAQDPYAFVPQIAPLTSEPYGIGVNKDHRDLAAYINRVLVNLKADGRWTEMYNRWFSGLGPAPTPPPSVFGRT